MTETIEMADQVEDLTDYVRTVEEEVGLRLPNGTEIWPPNTWHDRGIATEEDRKLIFDAILASADNLGLDPEGLISQYRWLVRKKDVYSKAGPATEFPLYDPTSAEESGAEE